MTDDDKTPIEHAVEVAVFAPIGFALEARRLLPSFVERGRQQVNMAKMVGQFAVSHGQATATKRLTKVQEQAEAVLAELGLAGSPPPGADLQAAEADTQASASTEAPAAAHAAPRSGAGAAQLPIAGYDSLAASQVIPRLAGLAPEELEAVRAYEAAHRGRKTILGKITQLTSE